MEQSAKPAEDACHLKNMVKLLNVCKVSYHQVKMF